MSKLCERCEMAIIDGSVMMSAELAEHLQKCPACREFAEFQRSLLKLEPAVPEPTVSFASIRRQARRQELLQRRRLKMLAWPLSIAAAGVLAVTGFVMGLRTSAAPEEYAVPAVAAVNWSLSDSDLETVLSGETIQLAWDTAPGAKRCFNSMSAARDGVDDWSIETFDLNYEGLR